MFGAAMNHPQRIGGWVVGVAFHQLRIADNGVERRADLVADTEDETALRLVRRLGDFLGPLQGCIGSPMRLDLVKQHGCLPPRFLLRLIPAFMREHHQPRGHPRQD